MNMKPPGPSFLQPDRIQGLVFDGAVFLTNVYWLDSILGMSIEDFSDRAIGILLVAGVVAQFFGVLLKKAPLQQRVYEREQNSSQEAEQFLGCLLFAHFIFFLIAAGMALALLGLVDLNEADSSREFLWFSLSMTVAAVTTGVTWLAIGGTSRSSDSKPWWPYQEVAGNILLWISAIILTRFFWEALLFESEPLSFLGFTPRALVLVVAVSVLFMVFYVPARLLFLVEDYKYPSTWLRLWLVAMFPLISVVVFNVG